GQSAGARVSPTPRSAAHSGAGKAPQGAGKRCGAARRASRLSQGRPRGGVLAILLSRRYLRFRRRAQRHVMTLSSRMYREAEQAPHVVREQLDMNAQRMTQLGALLRKMKPHAVVTCARGSSDNAATFAKYL